MADDDDTSAGLTPAERTRPTRRRASRSAGPASSNGAQAVQSVPAADASTGAGGAITLEADRPRSVRAADDASTTGAAQSSTADTDTADTDAADKEAAGEEWHPVVPTKKRRRGPMVGAIAAGLVIVVLVALGGWLLFERAAAGDRDARRIAFEDTARQTILNLTTIKPDTAKEDVERILAGASGEFRAEFDGREDPFVGIVKEANVTTVGKIVESGIENDNGDSATVLVAARADVSTPDGSQNGTRDFRMRVTVTDQDGTLTASKVEFVP